MRRRGCGNKLSTSQLVVNILFSAAHSYLGHTAAPQWLWLSRCESVRKMPPPGGAETCTGGHDAHSSHTLLIADMICLSCCYTPPYNMCMCMMHVASACLRTPASQHTIVPVCHMILVARSGRARPISRPRSESDVCTLRWRPHIELYTDSGRTR